ncbi:LysR family substrate-binding domain-containing protein [Streptomyces botrytidirepellens]|uniref:LysR family substrate-binding domain-containing protein n=1 Tax=Streptomyces botrytidirepellens TaxID=2486417 RepID=UPI003CCC4B64
MRPSAPVRGLRVRPWRHDQFVIALPSGHALAGDTPDPVDLARFADEPWAWLRREASPDYHDQLMATCRRAGFTPEARHIANSILSQLAMVACGLGVTLVPNVAVRSIQGPSSTGPSPTLPTSSNCPSSPGPTRTSRWCRSSCATPRLTGRRRTRHVGGGRRPHRPFPVSHTARAIRVPGADRVRTGASMERCAAWRRAPECFGPAPVPACRPCGRPPL